MKFKIVFFVLSILLIGVVASISVTASAAENSKGTRQAVLVELFTAEGCSSCPPADDLLMRLEKEQPVDSANIIVLGQHVDYWDQSGWHDKFSSARFSSRQNEYAETFRSSEVYTPQMIVDGQTQFNGSDARKALGAIAAAAQSAKARIEVLPGTIDNGAVSLQVTAHNISDLKASGKAQLYLAVTESGLQTDVRSGENGGRTLKHTGVVRELTKVDQIDLGSGKDFSTSAKIKIHRDWNQKQLHLVAFLQDGKTRRILGAASAPIAP